MVKYTSNQFYCASEKVEFLKIMEGPAVFEKGFKVQAIYQCRSQSPTAKREILIFIITPTFLNFW